MQRKWPRGIEIEEPASPGCWESITQRNLVPVCGFKETEGCW